MRTIVVIILVGLVFSGCMGPKMLEREQQYIRHNCVRVSAQWDNITIGSDLLTQVNRDASWFMTRVVRFAPDERVEHLLKRLREPSYTRFPGINTTLADAAFPDRRIRELTQEEQRTFVQLWSKTLSSILSSDAFETDTNLLERAIQGGELHIFYVLVGRYNTAETGHVDGAKIVVTDPQGRVVAKLRKRNTLLYPYRYIGSVKETDEYLF